jgi:hypothetical protein
MQNREPTSSTCDCSMFVRWAMAQAGLDVGLTTSSQWTANGVLPAGDTPQANRVVSRGVGPGPPPGGYRPRRPHLLQRGRRPQGARRPLARQRSDRPLLLERWRLQHPRARRLRRPHRLGPLDSDRRWLSRTHGRLRHHCKQHAGRHVDVADNGNESRASPVHHRHGIWRHFAASAVEAKPHG